MTALCADCGAELDDYGPCGCSLAPRQRAATNRPLTELDRQKLAIASGGMRAMVARKMARKRGEEP